MDLHHRHHALQACALLTELPVQNRTVFFRRLTCDLNMKFRNQLKGAASTGFIQMTHNLESESLYVHTYTAALKMAEEVRLELTRPLLNHRFSRPLPLDRLGLLFLKCGAGIGTRNRINSLEGCVAASAYPQTDFKSVKLVANWLRRLDSNQRPPAYETGKLPLLHSAIIGC